MHPVCLVLSAPPRGIGSVTTQMSDALEKANKDILMLRPQPAAVSKLYGDVNCGVSKNTFRKNH